MDSTCHVASLCDLFLPASFVLFSLQFMTLRRLNLEIQGYPESYATASHMIESRVIGEPHPYALAEGVIMSQMGYMGNEPMPGMGQLSVPPHTASQPTPMKAESDGAPLEKATTPTPTTEPMEDTTVDEVPVEKEKTAAV